VSCEYEEYFLMLISFFFVTTGSEMLSLVLLSFPCGFSGTFNMMERNNSVHLLVDGILAKDHGGFRGEATAAVVGGIVVAISMLCCRDLVSTQQHTRGNVFNERVEIDSGWDSICLLTLFSSSLCYRLTAWLHQWHPLIKPIYEE
jgi:hypothetical protein